MALSQVMAGRPPTNRPPPAVCECGDHGFVNLTKWGVALVDVADLSKVSGRSWCLSTGSAGSCYARQGATMMHRELAGAPEDQAVDHINRDSLDNRRGNLRVCTAAGNQCNRRKPAHARTSRFKGVYLHQPGKWRARIRINGKQTSVGIFSSEEDAGRAYDAAAIKFYGQFALTNFQLGLFEKEAA